MESEPKGFAARLRAAAEVLRRRPRPREKSSFYFRLGTLLESGVPVVQALRQAGGSRRIADAASFLAAAASRGEPLGSAMPREPALFDPVEVAFVLSGEASGNLAQHFGALARRFEDEERDRDEVRTGLAYPIFLLHFAVLVLPIPNLFRGGLGSYAVAAIGPLALLYAALLGGLLLHVAYRDEPWYGRFLDSLPVLARLRRLRGHARFGRSFAAIHSVGLPFDRCVSLAAEASGLPERSADARRAAFALREGAALEQAILLFPSLPSEVVAAIAVGEKAGRLEETVGRAAAELEHRARQAAERMRRLLPVAIYLAIALWIAWRIVGGYAEIYSQIR